MISIIIPVKNGARHVKGCIDSILSTRTSDTEIEVIVVDNGSTDETVELLAERDVSILREETPGPYAARNRGAKVARGDILAFTDIDCRVDPHWAASIRSAMKRSDAVCGMSLGAEGGDIARLIQERYQKNIDNRIASRPPLPIFDTRNAAIRRDVFMKVGGFDTRFQDIADDLLGIMARIHGYNVEFEPGMVVTHIHPESLVDVAGRQIRHGKYIPMVRRFYGEDVRRFFPGLNRYDFLDRPGTLFRIAATALFGLSYVAAFVFALKLRISLLLPGNPCADMLFDYYCRATTVMGICEARRSGMMNR